MTRTPTATDILRRKEHVLWPNNLTSRHVCVRVRASIGIALRHQSITAVWL
jgi:hypothetical protein